MGKSKKPKPPPSEEKILEAIAKRRRTIESWKLEKDDLIRIIAENPHAYSPILGFIAEYNCRKFHLASQEDITDIRRPSGYRKDDKGDFCFVYKNELIRLEVKSLDGPNAIHLGDGKYKGTFQCNASDARPVILPNGHIISTNCLVAGTWEVLAVSLFSFFNEWRFAFARNSDLPRASDQYNEEDRPFLLASSMKITWPLQPPFTTDLYKVLDSIIQDRRIHRPT